MALSTALLFSVKFHKSDEWFIIHNETLKSTREQAQMNNTDFELRFVVIDRQFSL